MLDDRLLQEFIFGFYGYGCSRAKYWFVGMEEGMKEPTGSKKLEKKIASKLNLWDERGRKELEDLVDFHRALGSVKHFDKNAPIQPTWNKIIHVLLGIQGQESQIAQVRDYQRSRLARERDCDSCLVELLPLPSGNVNRFPPYHKISRIHFLECRRAYTKRVVSERVKRLKSKIGECQPRAVVFYGKAYREHYVQIAGVKFTKRHGVEVGNNSQTLFVIVKHPNARGVTNAYFYNVGRMIAATHQ